MISTIAVKNKAFESHDECGDIAVGPRGGIMSTSVRMQVAAFIQSSLRKHQKPPMQRD